MEEHFVNYTQSLSLKELGFNEPCFKYQLEGYSPNVKTCRVPGYLELIKNSELNETSVAVPLKQQVFKWFRDEHQLIAYIQYYAEWNFEIFRIDDNIAEVQDDVCFDYTFKGGTYEEAESACIDKLIELIKEKKS